LASKDESFGLCSGERGEPGVELCSRRDALAGMGKQVRDRRATADGNQRDEPSTSFQLGKQL
jgi:hypothetical protein